MVLSLHKEPFVTTHFQFITAHFVRHCALKNALMGTGQTDDRQTTPLFKGKISECVHFGKDS